MANSKTLDKAISARNPSAQKGAAKPIIPVDPLDPNLPSTPVSVEPDQGSIQPATYRQVNFDARTDLVKAIKRIALETDRNERDIYNEAIQEYIDRQSN